MSLILDALNRAEQDRKNKNAVPDISTVHAPVAAVASSSTVKPMLVLMTISVMVIALILSVWFFRTSPPVSSTTTSPSVALPAVQSSMEVTSTAVASPAAEPVSTVVPALASVPAPAIVSASDSPAVENLYTETLNNTPASDASVEQLYELEEAAPVSEAIVTPFETAQRHAADFAAVNAAQEPGRLVTGMTAKPQRYYDEIAVQEFNSLAWNQKQQVPTISYSRHNFLPQNVSTVVINGETLGEGNAFGGGSFVVDEIFVDGVVLSFRGSKFKLRALSGWVNM